ncbi:MAG: amidohydrolase family protein [Solirubrobacteraceae bacterium]
MYSQRKLLPWVQALQGQIGDVALYDAHVHVGLHDPAGLEATADEAVAALRELDSKALVFPLKEPSGYAEANQTVAELAAEHPDMLRALARLEAEDEPLGRATAALDAGAVGVKLHPRGDALELDDPRLDDVFALADERRMPIMIHAGVGSPEVGDHAILRARQFPGARLILAHCGVGACERVLPHTDELPNLYFDTSWWNPADIIGLFRCVPVGRILYASDIPFSSPAGAMVLTGRLAVQAGLGEEALRSVFGGQLERLVAGDEPLTPPAPDLETEPLHPRLERLYVTLCSAVEPMLRGEPPGQGFELARVACGRAPDGLEDLLRSIEQLLALSEEVEDPDPLRPLRTPGFDLVLTAAVLARTPRAAVPA